MQKKIKLKIAIIGPPKSGKTAFIDNLLQKKFNQQYTKTQGYQLSLYQFSNARCQYEIQLWECGNTHLQFNKHIRHAYFKNCSAAFLMFDLTDERWKDRVQQWLAQAYEYDCFLVYAIGTKKDLYAMNRYSAVYGSKNTPVEKLTDSLLESRGIQTLDQLQINRFFDEFQVKHFYQQAVQPMSKQIRNIFISIENDQQKLTRSSLATGRRFDNSVVDFKNSEQASRFQMHIQSVKIQQFQHRNLNRRQNQKKDKQ